MKLSLNNFLYGLRQIVTGGGRNTDGSVENDAGFLKRAEGVTLQSVAPSAAVTATAAALTDSSGGTADQTIAAISGSGADAAINNNFADLADEVNKLITDVANLRAQAGLTADETNARVLKVEETVDSIGNVVWTVPRDYDEATDVVMLRVLASQLTSLTDNDVELDLEAYVKTAGSALGADLNPTAPGTVLSTTEQWVEFDLAGNSLKRDDTVTLELITNGANDTDGEEVLVHSVELLYRSTLVSYHEEDSSGNELR